MVTGLKQEVHKHFGGLNYRQDGIETEITYQVIHLLIFWLPPNMSGKISGQ